jgi:triacylglycerol lipase
VTTQLWTITVAVAVMDRSYKNWRAIAPCTLVQARGGGVRTIFPAHTRTRPLPCAVPFLGRKCMNTIDKALAAALLLLGCSALSAQAACVDNVVLVHGNTGGANDFVNTYNELRARGYATTQIYRPSWGSKTCAACNDHNGSEETPVENAMIDAIATSCTGKIDVIGHSMGATLAAREITRLSLTPYVESFVGIAGAFRGLWSCGAYPFNVVTSTCGYWGLSVGSPFLNSIAGKRYGTRVYSIKSYADEVVCSTGVCTVGGVHSSAIAGENASYTYAYGHYGLLWYTYGAQADLIR